MRALFLAMSKNNNNNARILGCSSPILAPRPPSRRARPSRSRHEDHPLTPADHVRDSRSKQEELERSAAALAGLAIANVATATARRHGPAVRRRSPPPFRRDRRHHRCSCRRSLLDISELLSAALTTAALRHQFECAFQQRYCCSACSARACAPQRLGRRSGAARVAARGAAPNASLIAVAAKILAVACRHLDWRGG
jgi:hypothetical protein